MMAPAEKGDIMDKFHSCPSNSEAANMAKHTRDTQLPVLTNGKPEEGPSAVYFNCTIRRIYKPFIFIQACKDNVPKVSIAFSI